jgi:1-acyl-sn-glycerol-3-phosphate acyltransferase
MHSLIPAVVHRFSYLMCAVGMPVFFSLRIEGGRHIPRTGPALLIANHQSYLDPILLGLCTSRPLRYLARRTLFKNAFFARLIRALRAVPIDQEGVGKEGLRTILDELHAGEAVVVYPEGERTADGTLHALRPGIHLLIRRAQAPVVPVGIAGAFEAWPRSRKAPVPAPLFLPPGKGTIAVVVGRPLQAGHFAEAPREQALGELAVELQKLKARAERLRRK